MPRPAGSKAITYHVPADHPALTTLDAYRAEWDKSRADASKDIVIAWAKARSGDLSALSGLLGITLVAGTGAIIVQAPQTPPSIRDEFPLDKGVPQRRPGNGNAKSVELDL